MKFLAQFLAICFGVVLLNVSLAFSQDSKEKKLQRPDKSDVSEVDKFVNKSFDAYEESLKITKAVNFIKVEEEGDSKVVKNANGETISKQDALLQLGELMIRAKKQNDNIQELQGLQKPATESIKKAPIPKKPKATKNLAAGNDALGEVVKETKNQIELIDKQMAEIRELND